MRTPFLNRTLTIIQWVIITLVIGFMAALAKPLSVG